MRKARFLPFVLAVVASCSSKTDDTPPVPDTGVTVEHEDPCGPDPAATRTVPSTRVATLRPKKAPLAKAGAKNPSDHDALVEYLAQGLGDVEEGPAEDGGVNDALLTGSGSSVGSAGRKSLAYFVQVTDLQIVDDESPTRLAAFDNPTFPGGARPQEGAVALATSAMHRTLGEIAKDRPFDFELLTGDCADSSQRNEHEWVLALLDGKKGLTTDSGDDDDPVPGPGNDVKDPFDSVPAPAPWYFVFGNHDVQVVGIPVPDPISQEQAIGTQPKMGTRDYRKKYAPVTRDDVPADPKRRQIDRAEIMSMLLASPAKPGPVGHGFAPGAKTGSYVVEPIAGVPLRLVTLDTTDPYGGSDGYVSKQTVTDFLEPALLAAEKDGKLVIVASHHPSDAIDAGKGDSTRPDPSLLTGAEVEQVLAKHPNVVLWIVGHTHYNRVKAIKGPSADAPGYHEVMTTSIADFPSQARAIEIVWVPPKDASEGTLSIFLSMIDYHARSCLESRFRTWSLVDYGSGWTPGGMGDVSSRNVELRRAVPKGVVLSSVGKPKIETETTLSGK